MCEAINVAKWFLKKGLDTIPNTIDGNMKLQKLLFFANCISLAKNSKPLFKDKIMAFKNGCVVETVRQRYRNDYKTLKIDSEKYNPDFSEEEYKVLNLTANIFGDLTAKELSELNYSFDFWQNAFNRSKESNGYKSKEKSVVSTNEIMSEISKIQDMIKAYEENNLTDMNIESINGVKFYYPKGIVLNEDVEAKLIDFSMSAEDKSYTFYFDNGNLVIF